MTFYTILLCLAVTFYENFRFVEKIDAISLIAVSGNKKEAVPRRLEGQLQLIEEDYAARATGEDVLSSSAGSADFFFA